MPSPEDFSPLPPFPKHLIGKVKAEDYLRDPCLPDFRAFIECCREHIHISLCEKEKSQLESCRGWNPTYPKSGFFRTLFLGQHE